MKCIEFNVFHSSQLAITLKNKNESKNCELATLKHAQFFNDLFLIFLYAMAQCSEVKYIEFNYFKIC